MNDTFGFFVTAAGSSTKVNCAVVPDGPDAGTDPDPVSINTINNGNPFGSDPRSNPELYRNNDLDEGGTIDAEPDGFTTVLTCSAAVVANQPNHLKLAIADRGDGRGTRGSSSLRTASPPRRTAANGSTTTATG